MKFLSVRLSVADVKRAIYDKDARFFKETLLSRLQEGAMRVGHFNWRCIGAYEDNISDTATLIFEEAPDSHEETLLTHKINRLLEAAASGKKE